MSAPRSRPLMGLGGMSDQPPDLPSTMPGITTAFGGGVQFPTPAPVDDSFFDAYVQQLEDHATRGTAPEQTHHGQMMLEVHAGPGHSLAAVGPQLPAAQLEQPSFDIDKYLVSNIDQQGLDEPIIDEELEDASPFSTTPTGRSVGKKGKQRSRTEKQQELNKQAQQRYRERRKAKFNEMERQVEELNKQVKSLEAVEGKNVMLTRRNVYLEKLVKIQSEEIAKLKREASLQADELGHSGEVRSMQGAQVLPSDADSLRDQLARDVQSLETVLKSTGTETGPAPPIMQDQALQFFRQKVTEVCDIHVRLLAVESPEVADVMTRDADKAKRAPESNEKMEECVRKLGLSGEQAETILRMRADHLTRMRQVYHDRNGLNLKAMGLMLPHPLSEKNGPFDATVDGKIQCQASNGYLHCKAGDTELSTILKEIKENLLKEQQSFMEMVISLLCNILDPVQAALTLVSAFPETVDALAFANTLALQSGQESINLDALASCEIPHVPSGGRSS